MARLSGRCHLATAAAAVLLAAAAGPASAVAPAAPAHGRVPQPPHLPGAPYCGPSIAGAEPTAASSLPPPAPAYFAPDFPPFPDERLGAPIGGFGGLRRGAPLHHTPVIFVHGNNVDAQNWLDVMLQFQNDAGYTLQEMYALSYNGLENYYEGAPDGVGPTALDADYLQQNPTALGNGGHGAADDDEVPDLCRFIEAVQWYTGSRQVDLVTHSLGVTIARETMRLYPALARDVVAFVGIAGANHGTSVCRGIQSTWYGCDEIAPGSPWLARLDGPGGSRETYRPTRWMTIYDGAEGDPLFVGPDVGSPQLRGADNRTFPGAYHNDLRVDPAEVDTYLPFLLRDGQAGPDADHSGPQAAATISRTQPDGLTGELCGVPSLTGPVAGCPPPAPAAPGPAASSRAAGPGRSTPPAVGRVLSARAVLPATGPAGWPWVPGLAATLLLAGAVAGGLRRPGRVVPSAPPR